MTSRLDGIFRSKKLKEENLLAAIVDSSDDAILSKDLDGIILSWNRGAEKLYGYTPEEVIGKHVSILAPPERPDEIPDIMKRLIQGERIDHSETVRVTRDGRRVHVSLTISPVRNSQGQVVGASAIARDVTLRKQTEAEKEQLMLELTRALSHQKLLLQEVYHRVKNNLQVISSLLDLRSRYITDSVAKAAFKESIQRIRAMALVHEKLYNTEDLQKLDFSGYLKKLIQQLLHGYGVNKRIALNIDGTDFGFNLDVAIPLGLIFNELVTNSIKHGFSSSQEGVISISCENQNGFTKFRYSDDGVGLPEKFDLSNAETFGFRIVRLLIKQINGTIDILPSRKGTEFDITILREENDV